MFSNSTEHFKWTLSARWSFIIYFFSPEGGLLGRFPFNPVVSIKRLYVWWAFVIHIHEVSYFSIVYFNVVSSRRLSLNQSLALVVCKCVFSVGGFE